MSGYPKSGKTHFCFSWPEPIKIYSFDLGADFVRTKFPKKEIDIAKFVLPIIDQDPPPPFAEPIFQDFKSQFKKDCAEAKYRTLVIDTATALWGLVHQAITEEKNRKKILEVEYHLPNLNMSSFFTQARNAEINLVTTQYLRDKYIDEKNTGKSEVDGWKKTEGQADINIWIESIDKGGQHYMQSTIVSNRFDRELNTKTFKDLTYEELLALLGVD